MAPVGANLWPRLAGLTGPESAHADELATIAQDGHTLLLLSDVHGNFAFESALRSNGQVYVSDAIQQAVLNGGGDQAAILFNVRQYLASVHNDPLVVAYYVMDDYSGVSVVDTLEKIGDLVRQDNQTAVFPRPTILGLKGTLDRKDSAGQSGFGTNHAAFDPGVTNFSPKGADIVAFYPYCESYLNDPASCDWNMAALLPYMLQQVRAQGQARVPGWDPNTLAWGCIAQAFGPYSGFNSGNTNIIKPRTQDMAAQATAYAKAGALFCLWYAWNDNGSEARAGNDPVLRQGMKDASAQARSLMGGAVSPPPPPPPPASITISNVAVTGLTGTDGYVEWTTSPAADTQVEYGPTTAYGSSTPLDPNPVTQHSHHLTGLTAGATYHYRAKSGGASSPDATFVSQAPVAVPVPAPPPPAPPPPSPPPSPPPATFPAWLAVSVPSSAPTWQKNLATNVHALYDYLKAKGA